MTFKLAARTRFRLLAVAVGFLLLGLSARPADAYERMGPEMLDPASVDYLDALETVQAFWITAVVDTCERTVTGTRVSYRCVGELAGLARTFNYSDYPYFGIGETLTPHFVDFLPTATHRPGRPGSQRFTVPDSYSIEMRRHLGRSWLTLAHNQPSPDPANDPQFLNAVQLTPLSANNQEDLRRVQVLVETAIAHSRTLEAARLYRNALGSAPAWAAGHFNLGLLYGELELYPQAIAEMQRYLYLSPGAEDARAVQDRIYVWQGEFAQ